MPNATWRAKSLPLAQWAALQNQFEEFQLATGAPENLAMFAVSGPGSTDSTIYLTGPGIAVIEALSPGDWNDADPPSGKGTALLVGAGDPWVFFGINKPY